MRRSVFCVCPPGNTQDSARVWRAITFGCIPVTFFRAFDLPFQRHMGMPYADFVLNIQPDDYRQLNARIQALLDNPSQLRRMQVRAHLSTQTPTMTNQKCINPLKFPMSLSIVHANSVRARAALFVGQAKLSGWCALSV